MNGLVSRDYLHANSLVSFFFFFAFIHHAFQLNLELAQNHHLIGRLVGNGIGRVPSYWGLPHKAVRLGD